MAKKPLDPQAKARRQKQFVIVGSVVLLALLGFQGPRTLKTLTRTPSQPPAPPAATTPPAPGSGGAPLAPPTLGGGAPTTPSATPTLVDSDNQPAPAAGQLVSFGLFASKDPFVPQLRAGGSSAGAAAAAPVELGPADTDSSAPPGEPSGPPGATATAPAQPTSATISVNGVRETVAVSADFPQSGPIFHLASLTGTEAKISIVGGSYASGAETVTLTLGKPLTLVNTADGTRYELRLLSTA